MNDWYFYDMYKYFFVIGIFNNGCWLKFDLIFFDFLWVRCFFIFILSCIFSKDMNIVKLNM